MTNFQMQRDAYAVTADDIVNLPSESESSDMEAPSYSSPSVESGGEMLTLSDEEVDKEVLDEQPDGENSTNSQLDSTSVSF